MSEVRVRRATSGDFDAIIELASASLGWRPEEPNEQLFRWKHVDNVFGASPMWVAEVDDRLAGFRTFLRWQFVRPDGQVVRAVRAVDTATHPDFQGKGIFTKLTTGALGEMVDDGVGFVFNTPNDQSRPGYLKMGWQVVGRPHVFVRPRSPAALVRMLRARVPAGKWSLDSTVGHTPAEVLHGPALDQLLSSRAAPVGLSTDRSPAFLAWRYGLEPLRYRVLVDQRGVQDGVLIFRLRSRGAAVEAVVADVLVPAGAKGVERGLVSALMRGTGADYLIRLDRGSLPHGRFLPLPRQGPILTWRALCETSMPALEHWALALGDIELF